MWIRAGRMMAAAFAGTTFKTQAACEKHHMKWDAATKTSSKGM
jgi:hypothetical protein